MIRFNIRETDEQKRGNVTIILPFRIKTMLHENTKRKIYKLKIFNTIDFKYPLKHLIWILI